MPDRVPNALVAACYQSWLNHARTIARDSTQAEDLVHSAYLRLTESFDQSKAADRPEAQVTRFMYTTMERLALNERSRESTRRKDRILHDLVRLLGEQESPGPDGSAERLELIAQVQDALQNLPRDERSIVEERFGLGEWEVSTLATIASRRGLTVNQVYPRLRRALEKLKSALNCIQPA